METPDLININNNINHMFYFLNYSENCLKETKYIIIKMILNVIMLINLDLWNFIKIMINYYVNINKTNAFN